jgi:hypothetical protein
MNTARSTPSGARYAAQNHRPEDLMDRIDDAEVPLLNVTQVDNDPHLQAALRHLEAAKALAARKDLRGAEAEFRRRRRIP